MKNWTMRATMTADDPNRRRPPRMRLGRPPDPKQRPVVLAEMRDAAGVIWRLAWLRATIAGIETDTGDWYNLKLYACGRALHKANYWISWNAADRRLKKWLDTGALGKVHPQLYQMLTSVLTYMWSGPAFDPVCAGLCVVRCEGEAVHIAEDRMHDALAFAAGGQNVTTIFTEADKPRLKELATLLIAERGYKGWNMAPDELTGGFRIVAK